MRPEIIIIGGGVVGSAIAYGLVSRNVRVLLLDGNDRDYRAAAANFGLVWLQGKGMNMPQYQQFTRDSIELWPDFSAELYEVTGIDLQYERKGGLTICLGQQDFDDRQATLLRLDEQFGGRDRDFEMIDRAGIAKLLPKAQIGADVSGASFGRRDGCTNPLRLLTALHRGIIRKGGEIRTGTAVQSISQEVGGEYSVDYGADRISAQHVVIAAGLGSKELGAQVGIHIPIKPQRGQVLVTERLEPFLPLPISGLRQTREGTVMIGATRDDAGFDVSTTSSAAAALSATAVRRIPSLSNATLVRQWAGLRILTPDRHPIYAESDSHPGVFVAACHSGVTLAAIHADLLARAIAEGKLTKSLEVFHHRRFDVPQAA